MLEAEVLLGHLTSRVKSLMFHWFLLFMELTILSLKLKSFTIPLCLNVTL